MNVPPVAAGALLGAAAGELAAAGADVTAAGVDELAADGDAAALLDVAAVAAGFDDEHATKLATTATDSAVVPPSRRPTFDVVTDFLRRLDSEGVRPRFAAAILALRCLAFISLS